MTVGLTKDFTGTEQVADPGPPSMIRVAWAPVPKVNLLPIEILENRRFRRTQVILAAAVVGVLMLAGAGTYVAQRSVSEANDGLEGSQARVTALQAQQARYAAVPLAIAQVEAAKDARAAALGTDVLWYRFLNDLDDARPAGVEFTSMTLTVPVGTGAVPVAGSSSNPLTLAGVGAIAIDGATNKYGKVADWMEALDKVNGVAAPALGSASRTEDDVTFSTSAVINSDALSGRYDKKAG